MAPQDGATAIFEDNQGAIKISKNDCSHLKTKHMAVRFHFVQKQVQLGKIKLVKMATQDMVADMLTKALGRQKVQMF